MTVHESRPTTTLIDQINVPPTRRFRAFLTLGPSTPWTLGPSGCSRSPRHAFTLIELLVVVAIIALLIGILLPSLTGARRQARTALCLAQEAQLGVALQIYVDDWKGSFPQVYGGPVAWGEEEGALYQLMVHSDILPKTQIYPRILVCPDADPRGSISYALNAVPFGYVDPVFREDPPPEEYPPDALNVPPLKMSRLQDTGRLVAFYDVQVASLARVWRVEVNMDEADISDQFTAEATHDWAGRVRPNPAGFMWHQSVDEPPITAKAPHGKSHNILFADLHAATHPKWDPTHMTRLTGWDPNDEELH
ncbi:MAG: prepilin-type N-terminal cleavage/methylation domain-containing protein [bacterium]|nr:prepilin-type N-terminal cleavage/methylation domain-containing protein [bacterium]